MSENPDETIYQVRMTAILKSIKPLQTDIATGKTYERAFVPFSDLGYYIDWGEVGKAGFNSAQAVINKYFE